MKNYSIKTNQELFDECHKIHESLNLLIARGRNLSTVVQNDVEVSAEQLNEWYALVQKQKQAIEITAVSLKNNFDAWAEKVITYIKEGDNEKS